MMKFTFKFTILSIVAILASCAKVQEVGDEIFGTTEREAYARLFLETDSIFTNWDRQFELAKRDSLTVDLPFVLNGSFLKSRTEVLSYNLKVKKGQRLIMELVNIPDSSKVFVDILALSTSRLNVPDNIYEGINVNTKQVLLDNGSDESIKVIIQPEIGLESSFQLKLYTEPIYLFPVSGYSSKAVGSWFGDQRDGGRRSHKGVDIFANRGTPVISVTEGRARKVGEYGLGGKQVWIADTKYGNSLYFAHLDSIVARRGQKVEIGDTLGFVGNTGNARTTPPHLHFAIYQRYFGALDPLPFIKEIELLSVERQNVGNLGNTISNPTNIRQGPGTHYERLLTINSQENVTILGISNNWYHIELQNGLKGFVHKSLLKEIESQPNT